MIHRSDRRARRRMLCVNVSLALALALPLAGMAGAGERLWPVPLRPAVSSNFCEYREGHLHAGLDIRTFGREGVPCLAASDGYVSRVRAAPRGYGQAVYLQIDRGETLVYAHLAQFAPPIDSAVVSRQERTGRYSVDFRLEPGAIPVRRGETIGYSGSTGALAPHLHFEVRNHGEHPLDPFSRGFSVGDTTAPSIERVVLVPLDVGARVAGRCYPAEFKASKLAPGRFGVDDTISVVGPVGINALVVDGLNADSGRLAPKTMAVDVDGRLVSRIDFEAFSFAQAGQVGFVYDVGRVRSRHEFFYELYERTGESLWNRRFADGGRLFVGAPPDGEIHTVRISARDSAGNEAVLLLHVSNGAPRGGSRDSTHSIDRVAWGSELDGFYFFEGMMASRSFPIDGSSPGRALNGDSTWVARVADVAGRSLQFIRGVGGGEEGTVRVAGLPGGAARLLEFPGLGVALDVGERTLYGETFLYATEGPGRLDSAGAAGLDARSGDVQIGPYSLPLRDDVGIRFSVENPDSNDAVYRLDERSGRWIHYASVVGHEDVTTTARRPGVYAVFADRDPPRVGEPVVTPRLIYASGRRVPELVVPIDDPGSGVDDARCAVFIAGVRQIARWEGRTKKLFVLLSGKNIMGPQALTVVAYDNIGHRSQLDTTVVIPRQKME